MDIKILLLLVVIFCVCYPLKERLTMDTTEDTINKEFNNILKPL